MATEFRNALHIGSRVDCYAIEAIIGHGGFGITYRAIDVRSGERVALKEYLPAELATRESDDSVYPLSGSHLDNFQWGLGRFLDEVQLLAQFKHPNIVRVERAFEANGTAYTVMDFENGESLAARLKHDGTLANDALSAMIMPLLDGLDLVHAAGFIHRDIKPSNIYLRDDGSPVLLDFGSARQALKGKTRTLTALVSAGYAPLEQYFSRSDLQGPWTDIYGLGATLYHAVSGAAPIDAVERSRGVLGSTRDILPPVAEVAIGDFPPCLLAAVDHALRVDDQERPRSIDAWRRELSGETPVPETPVTALATPQTLTIAADSKVTVWHRIGPAVFALAIAIGLLGWWQWPSVDGPLDGRAIVSPSADTEAHSNGQLVALRKLLADAQSATSASRRQIDALTARLRELETVQLSTGSGNLTPPPANPDDGSLPGQRDALVDELKAALAAANAESIEARENASELSARLIALEASQNQSGSEDSARRHDVDTLLAAAAADIAGLRLTTPVGNNAYERYLRVLELESNNAEARRGVERITEKYLELAKRAQDKRRFDEAERYLERATKVLPTFAAWNAARENLDEVRREPRREAVVAAAPETAAAVNGSPDDSSRITQESTYTDIDIDTTAGVSTGSTSKISIAIFPGSARASPSGFVGNLLSRMGESATSVVRKSARFELRYSYYASTAKNEVAIPEVNILWKGFGLKRQLDTNRLLALGKQYDLDAVLIYTLELGQPRGTWAGGFTHANIECRIFDIETSQFMSNKGDISLIEDITSACLSNLEDEHAEGSHARDKTAETIEVAPTFSLLEPKYT